MYFKTIAYSLLMLVGLNIYASKILIPMDEENQMNHLKAYGIAYWVLQNDIEVEWLLNYKGGSFLIGNYTSIQEECTIRGVSFEIITDPLILLLIKNSFRSFKEANKIFFLLRI